MAHETAEFERLVQDMLKEHNTPGLSIAIIRGDDIYAKGYGLADLSGKSCTENTLFDLASVSKSTTGAAVACLVGDEKYPDVKWTTPITKLLPEDFVMSDPDYTKHVTVEDILSHRSGMPRHDMSYLGVRAEHPDNAESMTRNLRNLQLSKPLRTEFQYCNIMYSVATHLVSTISKTPYDEFLQTKLWDPLGMTDTYHDLPALPDAPAQERLATGYHWDKEKEEYIAMPSVSQPEGQGAGLVFSTAADYAKWVRGLIQRKLPFSEDMQQDFISQRMNMGEKDEDLLPFYSQMLYALGLQAEWYRGHKIIGHDGVVPGYRTMMRYAPGQDWGILLLGNSDDAAEAQQVLFHVLLDELLEVPKQDRVNWVEYWRERLAKEEKDIAEANNAPELQPPENPEPLGVPVTALAGKYFDAGFKNLVIEDKDGRMIADCSDRCWPMELTFKHLTAEKFIVENKYVWTGRVDKHKAAVRIANGQVEAVGVDFEQEEGVDMIWFKRVK